MEQKKEDMVMQWSEVELERASVKNTAKWGGQVEGGHRNESESRNVNQQERDRQGKAN